MLKFYRILYKITGLAHQSLITNMNLHIITVFKKQEFPGYYAGHELPSRVIEMELRSFCLKNDLTRNTLSQNLTFLKNKLIVLMKGN